MDPTPTRMIAVWCPDWPVSVAAASAGLDADSPVAVITANHVVACSHSARQAGVRRGLRRREAQGRCPDLYVLPRDEVAEARAFEPVVAAVESLAPGVEITRPGLAALGARGPTRYFGGETAVVHALSRLVAPLAADVLIGVADGSFAAEQAARRGVVVEPGGSAGFLAGLPIEVVEIPELVDLLRRLGLRTLGAFAELPARDVLARFGPTGAWVHRQCGGRDARPVAGRRPAAEYSVDLVLEPPVDRIDTVAFSARAVAERFIGGLLAHGLACTCLELVAQTENGEETVRRWRQAGVLTAVDVVDRIRWQLEGWLRGAASTAEPGPSAGIILLRLVPVECVPTGAHQQSLWGGSGDADDRAHRALARVQTLLGYGSVVTPVLDGGRDPAQRTRLVAWGDERGGSSAGRPWPGRLPTPAPSVLVDPPRPVQVLDGSGRPVTVTARGAVPMPPARLTLDAGDRSAEPPPTARPLIASPPTAPPPTAPLPSAVPITAWAGPWPIDERWWDAGSTPRARFQLVDLHGRAYLVTCTLPPCLPADPLRSDPRSNPRSDPPPDPPPDPRWTLDAVYD